MASILVEKYPGEEKPGQFLQPRMGIKGSDTPRKAVWIQWLLHGEPPNRQVLENVGLHWRESGTIPCLSPYKQHIR